MPKDHRASDYYKILDIPENAPYELIKEHYQRLILEKHPDRNPSADAPEEFRRVHEAWNVLRNFNTRVSYDRELGHHGIMGIAAAAEVIDANEFTLIQISCDKFDGNTNSNSGIEDSGSSANLHATCSNADSEHANSVYRLECRCGGVYEVC